MARVIVQVTVEVGDGRRGAQEGVMLDILRAAALKGRPVELRLLSDDRLLSLAQIDALLGWSTEEGS